MREVQNIIDAGPTGGPMGMMNTSAPGSNTVLLPLRFSCTIADYSVSFVLHNQLIACLAVVVGGAYTSYHLILYVLYKHISMCTLQVPNDRVGLIIGKGGATIKDLQNRSGARIQIPPQPDANSNPPVRTVSITGVGDAPQRAKYEIEQMVQSFETYGYIGGGGAGGYQQQQLQQPSAYGPPGGHYGAPQQHAPAPYGAAPYGQPAYGAPQQQPYGMPQQGYGMPQQPYDQRYQQPGLTDPYAQQYGMQQQVAPMMHQQHYGQPQPQQPVQQQQQPVTAASAANSGGAGTAAAGTGGAAAAAAPAAAGNVDLTQYHSQFWQYAAYYGERVAREQYGAWSPPVGTQPPPGVTLPLPGHEQPAPQ
eukprot:18968-Heterococcus_DN1.PRE.1